MISKESCIPYILKEIPDFINIWGKYVENLGDESLKLYDSISEFSSYIIELMRSNKHENLPEIFNVIEYLLANGDFDVKNAVTTCCLENIMNSTSDEKNGLKYNVYVNLLGEKSKEFCRAYDKFTGINTPGL